MSVEVFLVLLELLVDVVDGSLVAGETKGSVAAVLLADVVKVYKSLSKSMSVRYVN